MKKKIIILGSTGSIGKITYSIIKKDRQNFKIELLSTNKNINLIIKQAHELKVKNLIISNYKSFIHAKKIYKEFKIFNSFAVIDKLFKNKEIHYSMNSIVGIEGLEPTLKLIKKTKNIAIVNKESLVCGWNLIKENLKKYKTNFIPIDSEHFSIFSLMKNINKSLIDKIYITASGGPFLNKKDSFKNISIKQAINHPNWKMGKKISIDSSTLMNKLFEVIEAKNIFDLSYSQISILIHPNSYLHAIVKFKNGIIKLLVHDPNMKIPIFNSIYSSSKKIFSLKKINFAFINNLNLTKVNKIKFPLINIINLLPKKNSLFETALVFINDYYVNMFLNNEIRYDKMVKMIYKQVNSKSILDLRNKKVKRLEDIRKIQNYLSFKFDKISI